MPESKRWFRLSVYSLGLAVLTVAGLPVGCAVTSRDNSGWDFLSDDIRFLSVSATLVAFFLLASLITGMLSLKQHRIAAIWVLPLSLVFVVAIGYSIFGLYIYVFNPFGAV